MAHSQHSAIGVDDILFWLSFWLCAAVSDNYFVCIDTLINDALVTRGAIDVFDTAIGNATNIFRCAVGARLPRGLIDIVRERCILLACYAHGVAFFVVNVTLKMFFLALSLN
ncbi:hypothetical protein ACWA46_18340 [Xanthomonas axonopodis pv. ricini]